MPKSLRKNPGCAQGVNKVTMGFAPGLPGFWSGGRFAKAMASIYKHPKSGILHVSFRYEGIQYGKSLRTRDKRKAENLSKATQRAVEALKSGRDKEGLKLIRRGFKVVNVIFPTAEVKRYIEEGERIPATLRELHDRWIEHLKNEGRADTTVDSAKHRLVHFLRHFGDDFRIDHLTKQDLDQYVGQRRKVNIAEYTIGREILLLKNIINKAVEFEWLAANPVKAWPKLKAESRKEFLPKEHVEELIATAKLTDEELEDLRSRMLLAASDTAELVTLADEKLPELALPIALVAVTGIRRGEMVSAKRTDVSRKKWTLTVASDKGSRKRKQVRRTIEIHQSVIPLLKQHLSKLKASDKLLFPVFGKIGGRKREDDKDLPARRDRAARLLIKLVANTPWTMLKGWHTLRHSAISIYLDQGYTFDQIAKWTGHVDPETQKLYTHWFDVQARERMDKLPFDFNNGNGERSLADLSEGDAAPEQMPPDDIHALVRENRALKVQVRKMQAEMPLVKSLQRRISVLERRLAEK